LKANQIRRQGWHTVILTLSPAVFDFDILTLNVTSLTQPLTEAKHPIRNGIGRGVVEKSNHRQCWLRARDKRLCGGCTSNPFDEIASSHHVPKTQGGTS
jgi:hypothetical protein